MVVTDRPSSGEDRSTVLDFIRTFGAWTTHGVGYGRGGRGSAKGPAGRERGNIFWLLDTKNLLCFIESAGDGGPRLPACLGELGRRRHSASSLHTGTGDAVSGRAGAARCNSGWRGDGAGQ